MIYSKWRPTQGGYDYFKAPGKDVPLGNDLPKPELPMGTAIGVASVEAGRSIPMGSKRIGSGPMAQGLVAPTIGASLFGLSNITSVVAREWLFAAGGVLLGWWISERKR